MEIPIKDMVGYSYDCDLQKYNIIQRKMIEQLLSEGKDNEIQNELANLSQKYINKCYPGQANVVAPAPVPVQVPVVTPTRVQVVTPTPIQAQPQVVALTPAPTQVPIQSQVVAPTLKQQIFNILDNHLTFWIVIVLSYIIHILSITHAVLKLKEDKEITELQKTIATTMTTFGAIGIFINIILFIFYNRVVDHTLTKFIYIISSTIIFLVNLILNLVLYLLYN